MKLKNSLANGTVYANAPSPTMVDTNASFHARSGRARRINIQKNTIRTANVAPDPTLQHSVFATKLSVFTTLQEISLATPHDRCATKSAMTTVRPATAPAGIAKDNTRRINPD